ncbi:MAG: hypothetical protein M1822_002096 [Bathelium mastoideum]|nr:MAG: hypothetical protein M1822_002096 [Bathelium mastoideum]
MIVEHDGLAARDSARFNSVENTQRFEEWFHQKSVFYSNKIKLRVSKDGQYRGLYATEDIATDEPLFTLNRSLVLSVENSDLPEEIHTEDLEHLDAWMSLILVLMHEWSKAQESAWNLYIDVLPIGSPSFQPLMFWPEDALRELQASPVLGRLGRKEAEEAFRSILLPILKKSKGILHPKPFPDTEQYVQETLLPLYHAAGSVIMAYAFDIERDSSKREQDEEGFVSDDEDALLPKGLIPMADMLNADADLNNARLFYEDNTLTMRAIKAVKAGEEIFNDYGPLPRSELLRRYGYTTPRYEKYDVAELPTDLITSLAQKSFGITANAITERLSFFDDHYCLADGYEVTRYRRDPKADIDLDVPESPFDSDLMNFVGVLLLPQEIFETCRDKRKMPKGDLFDRTPVLLLLEAACGEQRSAYPTTLDEDLGQVGSQMHLRDEIVRRLQEAKASGSETQWQHDQADFLRTERHLQGINVRIGEKTVLRDAESFAREMVSQISEQKTTKRAAEASTLLPDSKRSRH